MYTMKWGWMWNNFNFMLHGLTRGHMVILNYGEYFPPQPQCIDCSRPAESRVEK